MNADRQLAKFMSRYTPELRALAIDVLGRLRAQVPGAVELVYDNYNALVIGFSRSPKPSEFVGSLALYPKWVTLFFANGTRLRDPERLLQGNGKAIRSIRITDPSALDDPAVRALIAQGFGPAKSANERVTIIQSISPKQRPRRPASRRSA